MNGCSEVSGGAVTDENPDGDMCLSIDDGDISVLIVCIALVGVAVSVLVEKASARAPEGAPYSADRGVAQFQNI